MPHASPQLRRLRLRTGIKTGAWAAQVQYDRNAYSNVEHGHRSASPELYGRCARLLTTLLGVDVDPEDLMADPDDDADDEHEHTDAGTGPPNRRDSTGPGRLHPGAQSRGAA